MNPSFGSHAADPKPGTRGLILRTAHNLAIDTATLAQVDAEQTSRGEVMAEIVRHLTPFNTSDVRITGATVISKDLSIDSLAIMDMMLDLEDSYDISIPLNVVAEIHTVDELADTILRLRAERQG